MKGSLVFLLLIACCLGAVYCDDASPTVTIGQGTLVGHIYNTTYGSYYAFQGIPYAKPPVGELRFKPPVAAEPWTGTFQATQEGAVCVQKGHISVIGSEDCLFVNIYTAQPPDPSNLLPVMVWIHGGGYFMGSGNLESQGPAFLLNDGVIYVSMNYRLQALGYLSTEDDAAPGNVGMKDQVMALRWIQQNIAAFGGDPKKVTIFGESSGGASVSLHVVSPMSAGLFRSGICESGASVNPWSLRENITARETAFNLGSALGFTGTSTHELVDFLRTISAEDLVGTANVNRLESDKYRLSTCIYPPVVEPTVEGVESFLPENPVTLLAQGKFNNVSVLTGTNSAEAISFLGSLGMLDGTVPADQIDRNFTKILKPDLRFCKTEPCGDEMVAKIKSFYFGDEPVRSDNLEKFIQLATDMFHAEGTMYDVDKISSHNPVYFYQFSYDGPISGKSSISGAGNYSGVPHACELPYIFENGVKAAVGSTDAYMRKVMPQMWTNFVKTGNPTPDSDANLPKWLPYSKSNTYYFNIDAESSLETDFRKERMDFWRELYGSA